MDLKKILLSNIIFVACLAVFLAAFIQPLTTLAETVNLISNPSVEIPSSNPSVPQDWTKNKSGINTTAFSYPVMGNAGGKAVSLTMSSRLTGEAGWNFKSVAVTPSTVYTYSNYYISTVETTLIAKYKLKNGLSKNVTLTKVPVSAVWKPVTVTFTTPSNAASLVVVHTLNKNGQLTTDDFSLSTAVVLPTPTPVPPTPTPTPTSTPTPTPVPPTPTPLPPTPSPITPTPTPIPGNVIVNPSMESANASGTMPQNWATNSWGTNTPVFSYPVTGFDGQKAAKVQFNQYTNGDAKWFFDRVAVTPGDTYKFTDRYQSDIVSQVVVHFQNTDGTDYYLGLRTAPISSNWSVYSESFQIPAGAKNLTVYHLIAGAGWLITDDYSLTKITPAGFSLPMVTITFDDGWEDNVTTAIPILKTSNLKATYFFATSYLQNSPATGSASVSGPVAVKAIASEGHQIGSHSVTHPDLTTLTSGQIQAELQNSKTYLESLVGTGKVTGFASPYGAYTDAVINQIKPVYQAHRPTDEGFNTRENFDPYRLKVQNMQNTTTFSKFQSWVNQTVADKSWLILVYHRVVSSGLTQYDTSLTDFQNQLAYLKNSGAAILTLDQALAEISHPQITPTPVPTISPTPVPTLPPPLPTPTPGPNLVPNSDLEISAGAFPADWTTGNWGTNTTTFTYPAVGSANTKGAKAEITAYTDGDAKWYFSDIPVSPGDRYTFADYYQANISTRVVIRYTKTGTTDQYIYGETQAAPASADWTTYQTDFTVPAGVQSLTVFHLISQVGILTIDNVSLRKAPEPLPFASGMVSLDFDDGWATAYDNALPILASAGFKSTQYIVTANLHSTEPDYLTVGQIQHLQTLGHDIQSHSRTHPHLPALTPSQMADEIAGSKVDLAAIGVTASVLSYPYGEYNSAVISATRDAGYLGARTATTADSGFNGRDTDRFKLKTQSVENSTTLAQVQDWINTAVASKTWLILVFHQIDNSGLQYSTTPDRLQQIVDYLKNNSVGVVTVSQGLQQMH